MMMNELFEYIGEMWEALAHSFLLRSACSFFMWLGAYLFGIKHFQILLVFTFLVFLDLFTKWAAIAYKMLVDDGADGSQLSVLDKYWAIPLAFERGLISSEYMRKGFERKTFTYVMATAAAFLFDLMAGETTGKTSFAVNLAWLYLGSAEFLSILENLRDGGNTSIGRFLELARNKIETKVKI